jgi:hypothetical protein
LVKGIDKQVENSQLSMATQGSSIVSWPDDDDEVDVFGLLPFAPDRGDREIFIAGKDHPNVSLTNDEDFDPFRVASVVQKARLSDEPSPQGDATIPPQKNNSSVSKEAEQLNPKLVIKLAVHEEVAAMATKETETEGSSETSVEGTIYALVESSNSKQNAPFVIPLPSISEGLTMRPDEKYSAFIEKSRDIVVRIPKQEQGFVPVAHYSISKQVKHMPILVERKVTVNETLIRVAIQVRSKLTNFGDLEAFTIALAVPEKVDGASVEVVRGEGTWDGLKRMVKWKISKLERGESLMVAIQGQLWTTPTEGVDDIHFPVLVRCTSTVDQISDLNITAIEADGFPSSVSYTKTNAFRLLHRLR